LGRSSFPFPLELRSNLFIFFQNQYFSPNDIRNRGLEQR
jgi:hypothetical protein